MDISETQTSLPEGKSAPVQEEEILCEAVGPAEKGEEKLEDESMSRGANNSDEVARKHAS